MKQEDIKEKIAIFKYNVISPLIINPENYESNSKFFTFMSSKEHTYIDGRKIYLSCGTIENWYYVYKKEGLKGLYPKNRKDVGNFRKVSSENITLIRNMIQQFPRLKATDIYSKLSSEINCSYDTVNRIYKKIKEENKCQSTKKEMLRYEMQFTNDVWCADSSSGPYLYINNEKRNYGL